MMEQLTNGEILTEQGNGGARRWYLPFSKLRQPTPEHLNSLDFSPRLPPPIIVSATPRHISGRAFGAVLRRLFPYAPNKRRALGRRKGGRRSWGSFRVTTTAQQQQQQQKQQKPRPTRERETETGSGRPTAGFSSSKRIARVVGARREGGREGFQLTAHIQPSFEYNNIARGFLASVRRRIQERRRRRRRIVGGGRRGRGWN